MPDLARLSAFARAKRHDLTRPLRHAQVEALAQAWLPTFHFHEAERFHPVDVPALLTLPFQEFAQLTPDAQRDARVPVTIADGPGGQLRLHLLEPPVIVTPGVAPGHVRGAGATAARALDDDDLDADAVYTHGDGVSASITLFGASTSVTGQEQPSAGDPRRPRHPVVVRAELRVLLDTLKHELELDDLPDGLTKPIDAIWTRFAVEGSFFEKVSLPLAPFPESLQRDILRELVAAHERGEATPTPAALARVPAGWRFVFKAWQVVTGFAFLEYYLVYAMNDYKTYGTAPFANNHEGDVEGCCVVFERGELDRFAGGGVAPTSVQPHSLITCAHNEYNDLDTPKRLPVGLAPARAACEVFVAPGSHACYLTAGPHDILDPEDIATDLPGQLPGGWLLPLAFPGLFLAALTLALIAEHFVDAEDVTTDDGIDVGPGPDDEANLKFPVRVETTPLSSIETGRNIYQPAERTLLAHRGYPGKWGATAGFIDKSAEWQNKTDRLFRAFLKRGQVPPSIL